MRIGRRLPFTRTSTAFSMCMPTRQLVIPTAVGIQDLPPTRERSYGLDPGFAGVTNTLNSGFRRRDPPSGSAQPFFQEVELTNQRARCLIGDSVRARQCEQRVAL